MAAYLEVWGPSGPAIIDIAGPRLTIGKAATNDVVINEATVSRVHATLEELGGAWVVNDLGSKNGTFVNGDRVLGPRPLRDGDEVRAGQARVVFRGALPEATTTQIAARAPDLTGRERDVLVSLCRPILSGSAFSSPASVREIADELFVGLGAVKQHLLNLYAKFTVPEGRDRRLELANAAIETGAVRLADLRTDDR